jgi:hypothetical protein
MTISEKALADLLHKYFTSLEPVGKDVTLKNEMKKVAQPDGSTKAQMVPTKGDAYIPKDLSNAMAKAIAKAIQPNWGITGANAFDWKYLGTKLPAGISLSALTALYQFDGTGESLNDRSGNGRHLTINIGPESYCGIPVSSGSGTMVAMAFPEDKQLLLANASHNAAFRYLGAMVVELLLVYEGNTGTDDVLVDFGPPAHTEAAANNIAYLLKAHQDDGMFYYIHETGAGINQPATGNAKSSYAYPGLIQHVILNRTSGGDVSVIQNGVKVVEWTGLTLPTDCSNGRLAIGSRANSGISEQLNGAIACMRFLGGVSYNQAQWEESYKRVRGIIT